MIHYYGEDSMVSIGYCGVFVGAELFAARNMVLGQSAAGVLTLCG